MTIQQLTPLRRRMLDDMRLPNMIDATRRSYVRSVAGFSAFHGRSPVPTDLPDRPEGGCRRARKGRLRGCRSFTGALTGVGLGFAGNGHGPLVGAARPPTPTVEAL